MTNNQNVELKKRTWHYVMKPAAYSVHCDKCEGTNIEWSEYEHMIWCYDCEIDTEGFPGIFDGPIPWGISQILGISFDRWNMELQRVEYLQHSDDGKLVWLPEPNSENAFEYRKSDKRDVL